MKANAVCMIISAKTSGRAKNASRVRQATARPLSAKMIPRAPSRVRCRSAVSAPNRGDEPKSQGIARNSCTADNAARNSRPIGDARRKRFNSASTNSASFVMLSVFLSLVMQTRRQTVNCVVPTEHGAGVIAPCQLVRPESRRPRCIHIQERR